VISGDVNLRILLACSLGIIVKELVQMVMVMVMVMVVVVSLN
jgi:hypothetical protein